jgi:hypothetical protein
MAEENKENAVKFLEWMDSEGTSFSKVEKELGTLSAVLFFLRYYEE